MSSSQIIALVGNWPVVALVGELARSSSCGYRRCEEWPCALVGVIALVKNWLCPVVGVIALVGKRPCPVVGFTEPLLVQAVCHQVLV